MQRYYKTYETIYIARCEVAYLDKLTKSLDEYLSNDTHLSRDFRKLQSFYKKSVAELNQLKKDMDILLNPVSNGEDLNVLQNITTAGEKMRKEFSLKHNEFLAKIDCAFAIQINVYNPTINDVLLLANKHLTNTSLEEDDIIRLKEIINYFNKHRIPLLERSLTVDCTKNISINYDEIPEVKNKHAKIKSIVIAYDSELNDLHDFVKIKIILRSCTATTVKRHCSEILHITGEKTLRNPQGFFANPEVEQRKNDLIAVFNFIRDNRDFFFAAFSTEVKDQIKFQEWANSNSDALSELSDGLIRVFRSKDHITIFRQTLFGRDDNDVDCLIADDDRALGKFLSRPISEDFVHLLKNHLDSEIIAKWRLDNPPSFDDSDDSDISFSI